MPSYTLIFVSREKGTSHNRTQKTVTCWKAARGASCSWGLSTTALNTNYRPSAAEWRDPVGLEERGRALPLSSSPFLHAFCSNNTIQAEWDIKEDTLFFFPYQMIADKESIPYSIFLEFFVAVFTTLTCIITSDFSSYLGSGPVNQDENQEI